MASDRMITINNRYQYNPKQDLLGKGGFARVYRARDEVLKRFVALKISPVQDVGKYTLIEEIKRVIDLNHPNIIRYYDVFSMDGQNAAGAPTEYQIGVMEYANNGNLKDYFKRGIRRQDEFRDLVIDMLNGIDYLHENHIIHRDIKPQNILLHHHPREGMMAKLGDFGLSKNQMGYQELSSGILGTVEYMAPEQIAPKRFGIQQGMGQNADLWAFGAILYEAFCGHTPYKPPDLKQSNNAIFARIISEEQPQFLDPRIPSPYREMVEKCLVKQAGKRAQSAKDLLALLDPQLVIKVAKPSVDVQRDEIERPQKRPVLPPPPKDRKALKALGLLFFVGAISYAAYQTIYPKYVDAQANRYYVVSDMLNLRSSCDFEAEDNILEEIPYQEEVLVYEQNYFGCATVKVAQTGSDGFVSMKYLVSQDSLGKIEAIYGNPVARELVINTGHKKAITAYLSQEAYRDWKVYGQPKGSAYNCIALGHFTGNEARDMACVIHHKETQKSKLLIFQFDEKWNNPRLVYDAPIDSKQLIKTAKKGEKWIVNGELTPLSLPEGVAVYANDQTAKEVDKRMVIFNGKNFVHHIQE